MLVCVGVMTYLPDVEAVWREFARVVRSGGLVVVTQREDLWEPRRCQEVVDRLATEGLWTPLDVSGPAPYLPEAIGGLAELGGYYVTARISTPGFPPRSRGGDSVGVRRHDPALAGLDDDEALAVEDELERLT